MSNRPSEGALTEAERDATTEPDVSERDEFRRLMADHTYAAGSNGRGCLCGWRREHGDDRTLQEQHTDHLYVVLLAAGCRRR